MMQENCLVLTQRSAQYHDHCLTSDGSVVDKWTSEFWSLPSSPGLNDWISDLMSFIAPPLVDVVGPLGWEDGDVVPIGLCYKTLALWVQRKTGAGIPLLHSWLCTADNTTSKTTLIKDYQENKVTFYTHSLTVSTLQSQFIFNSQAEVLFMI